MIYGCSTPDDYKILRLKFANRELQILNLENCSTQIYISLNLYNHQIFLWLLNLKKILCHN